jgi:putative ABC transport system permease protein
VFNFYTSDAQGKMPVLANDLKSLAGVKAVTSADNYLSQFVLHDYGVYLEGGTEATATDAQNIACDEFFIKTNGIKVISGRDFMKGDSNKVLINQTLAKRLNLNPQTAQGAKLYSKFSSAPASFVTVVGVMKDFNYNSLHDEVKPFMLIYDGKTSDFSSMIVSVNSSNYGQLLRSINAVWTKDLPAVPFQYAFLDDEVQKQYESEIIISHIINSFTSIAIIISCLGLFGLAAFSAEQRKKEIGIRKVLGSSVSGIVSLLSKDFLILVGISFIIATPIAWYFMSHWFLQGFAYRIPLSWWMFALAGVLAVAIALVTVSSQAIKAAVMNPVKSLKTE